MIVGGGCFWCVDSAFRHVEGVKHVQSGYAGGHIQSPNYNDICTGQSGHAEVVKVWYDPDATSYDKLLDIFFKVHDPTTLNKQGHDEGTQYRSTIMYTSDEQKVAAQEYIKQWEATSSRKVSTEVVPLQKYWPAEEGHQDYWEKNPGDGYCEYTIKPKLEKIKDLENYKAAKL